MQNLTERIPIPVYHDLQRIAGNSKIDVYTEKAVDVKLAIDMAMMAQKMNSILLTYYPLTVILLRRFKQQVFMTRKFLWHHYRLEHSWRKWLIKLFPYIQIGSWTAIPMTHQIINNRF